MIVIKVELHSAITGKVTTLATAKICNDGTGTKTRGNYRGIFFGKDGRIMKDCAVLNWPRKARHVWKLVGECMKQAGLIEDKK